MEVTDRLSAVTQVTFQYDISSFCHSHHTLISTAQRAFTLCLLHSPTLSLPAPLSLTLSLHCAQEQSTYSQMWLQRTLDKRLRRSFFQWGGACWHEGRDFLHNNGGRLTEQIFGAEGWTQSRWCASPQPFNTAGYASYETSPRGTFWSGNVCWA